MVDVSGDYRFGAGRAGQVYAFGAPSWASRAVGASLGELVAFPPQATFVYAWVVLCGVGFHPRCTYVHLDPSFASEAVILALEALGVLTGG